MRVVKDVRTFRPSEADSLLEDKASGPETPVVGSTRSVQDIAASTWDAMDWVSQPECVGDIVPGMLE